MELAKKTACVRNVETCEDIGQTTCTHMYILCLSLSLFELFTFKTATKATTITTTIPRPVLAIGHCCNVTAADVAVFCCFIAVVTVVASL